MVSQKWLEQRFDQMFTMIEAQSQDIKSLKTDLKEQKVINKEQQAVIKELTTKVQEQGIIIQELTAKVATLAAKIETLAAKVETLEAKVEIICNQLKTIAPLFRHPLESDNSLLLDPDYKEELRDTLDEIEFHSANDIVTSLPEYEEILGNYKNAHGLASGSGKALSGFYVQVLGYKPRKIQYKAGYHKDIEKPIYDCVSKLYQAGVS